MAQSGGFLTFASDGPARPGVFEDCFPRCAMEQLSHDGDGVNASPTAPWHAGASKVRT
jgi:hypothetical protein